MAALRVWVALAIVLGVGGIGNAHAGVLSRAQTQGERLDDGAPVPVAGVFVYSFLQDGSDNNRRLAKNVAQYHERVKRALQEKGISVGAGAFPEGTLQLDVRPRDSYGVTGHVRKLHEGSREVASGVAREHRDVEAALPASHRLLLLPERVAWRSGHQWGTRVIRTRAGAWAQRGAVGGAVPRYSYTVLWLLEDVHDQPIAAGTTAGVLDIRGFPAKPMINQMVEELEALGIQWVGSGACIKDALNNSLGDNSARTDG